MCERLTSSPELLPPELLACGPSVRHGPGKAGVQAIVAGVALLAAAGLWRGAEHPAITAVPPPPVAAPAPLAAGAIASPSGGAVTVSPMLGMFADGAGR